MRSRVDWQLLLTQGNAGASPVRASGDGDALGAGQGPLPDNVHVVSWAPQLEALAAADVAIVHGGTNTADECILAGVPMLVYCGHETDMAGTTSRIEYHGLGLVGDPASDSADDVVRQLERLLGDDRSFAERISVMARRFERYREERVAEKAVRQLLESDPW